MLNLEHAKGHEPQKLKVFAWALDEGAVAEPIHKQRSHLCPSGDGQLAPLSSCSSNQNTLRMPVRQCEMAALASTSESLMSISKGKSWDLCWHEATSPALLA